MERQIPSTIWISPAIERFGTPPIIRNATTSSISQFRIGSKFASLERNPPRNDSPRKPPAFKPPNPIPHSSAASPPSSSFSSHRTSSTPPKTLSSTPLPPPSATPRTVTTSLFTSLPPSTTSPRPNTLSISHPSPNVTPKPNTLSISHPSPNVTPKPNTLSISHPSPNVTPKPNTLSISHPSPNVTPKPISSFPSSPSPLFSTPSISASKTTSSASTTTSSASLAHLLKKRAPHPDLPTPAAKKVVKPVAPPSGAVRSSTKELSGYSKLLADHTEKMVDREVAMLLGDSHMTEDDHQAVDAEVRSLLECGGSPDHSTSSSSLPRSLLLPHAAQSRAELHHDRQTAELDLAQKKLTKRYDVLDKKMSTNLDRLQEIAERQYRLGGALFQKNAQTAEWKELEDEKNRLKRENQAYRRRIDALVANPGLFLPSDLEL